MKVFDLINESIDIYKNEKWQNPVLFLKALVCLKVTGLINYSHFDYLTNLLAVKRTMVGKSVITNPHQHYIYKINSFQYLSEMTDIFDPVLFSDYVRTYIFDEICDGNEKCSRRFLNTEIDDELIDVSLYLIKNINTTIVIGKKAYYILLDGNNKYNFHEIKIADIHSEDLRFEKMICSDVPNEITADRKNNIINLIGETSSFAYLVGQERMDIHQATKMNPCDVTSDGQMLSRDDNWNFYVVNNAGSCKVLGSFPEYDCYDWHNDRLYISQKNERVKVQYYIEVLSKDTSVQIDKRRTLRNFWSWVYDQIYFAGEAQTRLWDVLLRYQFIKNCLNSGSLTIESINKSIEKNRDEMEGFKEKISTFSELINFLTCIYAKNEDITNIMIKLANTEGNLMFSERFLMYLQVQYHILKKEIFKCKLERGDIISEYCDTDGE